MVQIICKMSPRTSSLCSHIFLVLRDHWLYVCLHLKMEFRSCARGRQWCDIFHYHWWTASIKPRLLFSHSGLVSWGLPFLQSNIRLWNWQVKCYACLRLLKAFCNLSLYWRIQKVNKKPFTKYINRHNKAMPNRNSVKRPRARWF